MTTERGQPKGSTLQGIQGEGTSTRSKSPRQVFNDKYLELLKQNGWGGGYNVTTWLVDMCGDHGCVFILVGYVCIGGYWEFGHDCYLVVGIWVVI